MKTLEILALTGSEAVAQAAATWDVAPEEIDLVEEFEPDEEDLAAYGGDAAHEALSLFLLRTGSADLKATAQAWVEGLLSRFQPLTTVDMLPHEDGFRALIHPGQDASIIIGRDGSTLNALQHIVSRIVPRMTPDMPEVLLDLEDYIDRKHERLERIGLAAIKKARQAKRPVALKPMPSGDRKYLHHLLKQSHPEVDTRSDGREPNRHLVIVIPGVTSGQPLEEREARDEKPTRKRGSKGRGGKKNRGDRDKAPGFADQPAPPPPVADYAYEEPSGGAGFDETEIEEKASVLPPYVEPEDIDDDDDGPLVDSIL